MEQAEPTTEEADILQKQLISLMDMNKELDSILELQISLMKRPEPAIEQQIQDLCCPQAKTIPIWQQIMIAILAIPFEVYVQIMQDIKSTPLIILQLGYMLLYTLLYELVFTLAACPHWYPLWLMRYVRNVTPFCVPLGLYLTLHCYWNGYQRLAAAMAGGLVGHLHGQVQSPEAKAHRATLEAVKNIYQEAYEQMKEDSSKSLDEAYALLRKETSAFRQERIDLWETRLKEKQHYVDESVKDLQRMKQYQDSMIESKEKHIETMEQLNAVLRDRNEKTKQEQERQQQKQLEELEQRVDPWGATHLRWRATKDACGKKKERR